MGMVACHHMKEKPERERDTNKRRKYDEGSGHCIAYIMSGSCGSPSPGLQLFTCSTEEECRLKLAYSNEFE